MMTRKRKSSKTSSQIGETVKQSLSLEEKQTSGPDEAGKASSESTVDSVGDDVRVGQSNILQIQKPSDFNFQSDDDSDSCDDMEDEAVPPEADVDYSVEEPDDRPDDAESAINQLSEDAETEYLHNSETGGTRIKREEEDEVLNLLLASGTSGFFRRGEKSLGALCDRFIGRFPREVKNTDPIPRFRSEVVAHEIGIDRRRLYDVINILESLFVVRKDLKTFYRWHGFGHLPQLFKEWREEAEQEQLGEVVLQAQHKCQKLEQPRTTASTISVVVGNEVIQFHRRRTTQRIAMSNFCKNYIKCFLVSEPPYCLSLDAVSAVLIPELYDEKASDIIAAKSRYRRLYDIANILTSMELVRKLFTADGGRKQVVFQYTGPLIEGMSTTLLPGSNALKGLQATKREWKPEDEETARAKFARFNGNIWDKESRHAQLGSNSHDSSTNPHILGISPGESPSEIDRGIKPCENGASSLQDICAVAEMEIRRIYEAENQVGNGPSEDFCASASTEKSSAESSDKANSGSAKQPRILVRSKRLSAITPDSSEKVSQDSAVAAGTTDPATTGAGLGGKLTPSHPSKNANEGKLPMMNVAEKIGMTPTPTATYKPKAGSGLLNLKRSLDSGDGSCEYAYPSGYVPRLASVGMQPLGEAPSGVARTDVPISPLTKPVWSSIGFQQQPSSVHKFDGGKRAPRTAGDFSAIREAGSRNSVTNFSRTISAGGVGLGKQIIMVPVQDTGHAAASGFSPSSVGSLVSTRCSAGGTVTEKLPVRQRGKVAPVKQSELSAASFSSSSISAGRDSVGTVTVTAIDDSRIPRNNGQLKSTSAAPSKRITVKS